MPADAMNRPTVEVVSALDALIKQVTALKTRIRIGRATAHEQHAAAAALGDAADLLDSYATDVETGVIFEPR